MVAALRYGSMAASIEPGSYVKCCPYTVTAPKKVYVGGYG